MSTTEGFWSGKLFKIKLDGEEIISAVERNFKSGCDWENKKRKIGKDKSEERGGKKKKGNNNNDKESRFRRNMDFGEERRDLRQDFGDDENFGAEKEGENETNNSNNTNNKNDKNNDNIENKWIEVQGGMDDESANEESEKAEKMWSEEDGKPEEAQHKDNNNDNSKDNDNDNNKDNDNDHDNDMENDMENDNDRENNKDNDNSNKETKMRREVDIDKVEGIEEKAEEEATARRKAVEEIKWAEDAACPSDLWEERDNYLYSL